MSRKTKFTPEEKEQVVIDYLDGKKSRTQICEELCISSRTIQDWVIVYNRHGIAGFSKKTPNRSYSKECKRKVVQEYIRGEGSSIDLGIKYNISSGLLRSWVRMYNANRELKDYEPKQESYMAEARRKTTLEELKEIVGYCINHNRNYKDTAAKFDVSYSQVYSWVKKYDADGTGGLADRRGHHKTDDEVDELERLRRENLRLKRQLEEKDMVVELLKKVKEFERMCKQIEIARAAYYKWLHRIVPCEELENVRLAELMGVHSLIQKKKKKYTYTKPEETAENMLQRDFYAAVPNQKWATDVTEFKVPGEKKKLYLSAIIDLYDRYPVAYDISTRNDNRLVFKTFDKAIAANPDAKPIFHSDRGFQYTSKTFKKKLEKQEMEQSMSRVGHCIDNGPTEGFWGIIKSEMYQMYEITDETSLRYASKDYLRFYSEERPQDRYHCKTPSEVRQEALASGIPAEYPIAENKRINKYKEKWCA